MEIYSQLAIGEAQLAYDGVMPTVPRLAGPPYFALDGANLNTTPGWGAYCRNGTSSRKFTIIDSYVQERLAIFDSAKHGQTGRTWLRHDRAWSERLALDRLSRATQTVIAHA